MKMNNVHFFHSPADQPINVNITEDCNPTYPVAFQLGSIAIFMGRVDLHELMTNLNMAYEAYLGRPYGK